MPKFRYRAVDDYGNYSKGLLEAGSYQTAVEELKNQGLWIIQLFDQSQSLLHREIKFGGPKVKQEHFSIFCRQLATMYQSGINLVEAVRTLSVQTESKPFRKILTEVAEDMQHGTQFSVAIASYPTVFTTIFVSMIRAGEVSGNLDEMLIRLAVFTEKEYYTKEKVKSAMVYPVIMAIVTVMVVTILMMFVVPRFVANFNMIGLELPLPTRIVIGISNFVRDYWWIVIPSFFIPSIIYKIINRTSKGSYWIDYIKLKVPVFGVLWHKQAIARFSRTFSSLFAAAIPMLQMMTIVADVVGNKAIGHLIKESRDGIRGGQSIADPFQNSQLFPPMVVQMLSIGERSGSLDTMLEKVADFYEADVDAMADRLKSLLEPLMILILSAVVGGIVLAVMMPTFKLLENF